MASNKKDLKAYVRYDGTGRAIAGSLILQRFKPKDGNWQEVQAYECCDPSCPNPIYGQDWIIFGQQDVYGGIILNFAINPDTVPVMQVQFTSCETGKGVGEIITIDQSTGFEYNWFIPTEVLAVTCAIQVRQVCGVNYTSNWSFQYGG